MGILSGFRRGRRSFSAHRPRAATSARALGVSPECHTPARSSHTATTPPDHRWMFARGGTTYTSPWGQLNFVIFWSLGDPLPRDGAGGLAPADPPAIGGAREPLI